MAAGLLGGPAVTEHFTRELDEKIAFRCVHRPMVAAAFAAVPASAASRRAAAYAKCR